LKILTPPNRHFCPNAIKISKDKLKKVQKSFIIVFIFGLADVKKNDMEKRRRFLPGLV
jgi:hypothetical protein